MDFFFDEYVVFFCRRPAPTKILVTKVWVSDQKNSKKNEDVSKNYKTENKGLYHEEVPVNTEITHV